MCLILVYLSRSVPDPPFTDAPAFFVFVLVLLLKVIGTHNSYHRRTNIPTIGDMFSYDFPSIVGQLDAGVRHLELDVHFDWKTRRLYACYI